MNPNQTPQIQQPIDNQTTPTPTSSDQNQFPSTPQTSPSQNAPLTPLPKTSNKIKKIILALVILAGLIAGFFLLLNYQKGIKKANIPDDSSQELTYKTQNQTSESTETLAIEYEKQRNSDLNSFYTAVTEFMANNNGQFPKITEIDNQFIEQYLKGSFKDPETKMIYHIVESNPSSGEIQFKTTSACSDDNQINAAGSRDFTLRMMLNNGSYYCL